MNEIDFSLKQITKDLCSQELFAEVCLKNREHDLYMPSIEELKRVVEILRSVLFPGYHLHTELREDTMEYYIGGSLDKCYTILVEQLKRGYCLSCNTGEICQSCEKKSKNAAKHFLKKLPYIREMLAKDAQAAFEGDPAAKSVREVIVCYPGIRALTNHRLAHELYKLDVPIIPRLISELAHSQTGIDIHPGAEIGEYFFMDHGTGTVIGETTIIGRHVQVYQGVTLGAKSFPKDENGNPIKDIPRHPIVQDNVIIYAGATVLGRVTIGEQAIIGGNVWITRDISPKEQIILKREQ